MQKYTMKSDVRSCKRWSELRELVDRSMAKGMISLKSANWLFDDLKFADQDDIEEFNIIRKRLLDALNGKRIAIR